MSYPQDKKELAKARRYEMKVRPPKNVPEDYTTIVIIEKEESRGIAFLLPSKKVSFEQRKLEARRIVASLNVVQTESVEELEEYHPDAMPGHVKTSVALKSFMGEQWGIAGLGMSEEDFFAKVRVMREKLGEEPYFKETNDAE